MSHTNFTSASETEIREMLAAVGASSFDDLFQDIPAGLQADDPDIPEGLSELEALAVLRRLASRNAAHLVNFCGGGFYDHFIPSAVGQLSGRGEFFTAYTPYQPEASQGTLQAIYEYQTAIVRLTGMEAANASLYDGGTALFEAVTMAMRATDRSVVVMDEGVNPIYRTMLRSYLAGLNIACREVPMKDGRADRAALGAALGSDAAAVVVQNPNFFGVCDDLSDVSAMARAAGAMTVMSTYPVALGILKTPGEMGADIATGEGQCLGLPLSFGGPYLGFMATLKKHIRRMPGRVVGVTRDQDGRRGFVLTLQAREQHIRRDKATSNICTNQALCALRALSHLTLLGKEGFVQLARVCAANAEYAFQRLTSIPGVRARFDAPFFNEFALDLPKPAADIIGMLSDHGIAAGFPVGRYYRGMENVLLLAFTEKRTKEEIDVLASRLEAAVG